MPYTYPTPITAQSPNFSDRLAARKQTRNEPRASRTEIIWVDPVKPLLKQRGPADCAESACQGRNPRVDVGEEGASIPCRTAHGDPPGVIIEQRLKRRSRARWRGRREEQAP